MNRLFKSIAIAGISLLGGFCLAAAPAQSEPSRAKAPGPKSVFEEKIANGKDPFFPNSARRVEKIVQPNIKQPVNPVIQLSLKAITGPSDKRLALINNQTFAAGEERMVRVPNGQVRVRCVEIGDSSVVVTVENEPERKVLKLREGL